jgi:hypothetical protein
MNAQGTTHRLAKLTWEAVGVIRSSNLSDAALAREFGVTTPAVRLVRLNRTWVDPDYSPRESARARARVAA